MTRRIRPPAGLEPLGFLPDGVPFFAPIGLLQHDEASDRVQCHLCGAWLKRIGTAHLSRVHDIDADTYRAMFSLSNASTLQNQSVSAAMRERWRARILDDDQLRSSMARAQQQLASNRLGPSRPRLSLDHRHRIHKAVMTSERRTRQLQSSNDEALRFAQQNGYPDFESYVESQRRTGKSLSQIAQAMGRSRTWLSTRLGYERHRPGNSPTS